MKHYPFHIGDYLKDTAHLTLLEHGVYRRILDIYYTQESPILESDFDILARKIGARTDEEIAILKVILSEFFRLENGKWTHKRADFEIAKFKRLSEHQRARIQQRYRKHTGDLPDATEILPAEEKNLPPEEKPYTNQEPIPKNHNTPLIPLEGEARTKRATQLPSDWTPTEAHRQLAQAEGKDLEQEILRFTDYHLARGSIFKCWNRAFNTWLRNHFQQRTITKNDHRFTKRASEHPESFDIPMLDI